MTRTPFNIPQAFWLFGLKYRVYFDREMAHKNDAVGHANYRMELIGLQPITESQPRTSAQIEQNFMHELVHHIAMAVGIKELIDSEDKTDLVARALHQALTTMEGTCPLSCRDDAIAQMKRDP